MKWSRQIVIFIAIFLMVGLFMRPGGCTGSRPAGPAPGARFVTVSVAGRPRPDEKDLAAPSFTVQAEVADTSQSRQKGLVGRDGLQPGYGMLYVYPGPQRPKFDWSQMAFPVSDAFLGPDGAILDIRQIAEHEQGAYTPKEPVRFVLEVRGGWFQDRGVRVGDRLVLPDELTGQEAPAATVEPAPAPAEPAK